MNPDDSIVTANVGGVAVVIIDIGGGSLDESGSYEIVSSSSNNIQLNNRFKCPFCSNTYKSSTSKPYYTHLKKNHSL